LLAFKDALPAGTPCIVSCRRDDYVGELDLGLDTLSLEPLTPQRIRRVLCHWLQEDVDGVPPGAAEGLFWQLAGDRRLADVLSTRLRAGSTEDAFWSVPNPRSLLRLAANPFMLTMLYQVWVLDEALPRNRGELFARFVDRLPRREGLLVRNDQTQVWERTSDGERLVDGLTALAWVMQGQRLEKDAEAEADFGVLTVVSRGLAVAELKGEALLKRAEDATLVEGVSGVDGSGDIRFRHQLLQE